jgi:hypothetical protein
MALILHDLLLFSCLSAFVTGIVIAAGSLAPRSRADIRQPNVGGSMTQLISGCLASGVEPLVQTDFGRIRHAARSVMQH